MYFRDITKSLSPILKTSTNKRTPPTNRGESVYGDIYILKSRLS